MATPTTAQYHRRMAWSIGSRASTPSAFSDDEDAITPVVEPRPVAQPAVATPPLERGQRSRTSSVASGKMDASSTRSGIEGIEDVDTARLWQRMLALQRKLRCYNSARITAAIENESVGAIVRMYPFPCRQRALD